MAHQPLEGPRQRRGGGLVTGHQQRHQLVAQLLVRHRAAVLVPGQEQQRQDVVALLEPRVAAAGADQIDQLAVHRLERAAEARHVAQALGTERRHEEHLGRARGPVEGVAQDLA